VIGALAAIVCVPDSETSPTPKEASEWLDAIGPEVVGPTLSDFDATLGPLRDAVVAWDAGGDREDVHDSFLAAMGAWQRAEPMQIGPAASSLTAQGGGDLRDEIYSWPTINPCLVDQQTVAGGWDAVDFFDTHLVNAYGLDALEHLLFAPGDGNACSAEVDINAEGTWDTLGTDGIDANRASYALTLVDGLLESSATLRDAWDSEGGDFGELLADPSAAGSPYGTQQDALDAAYEAMFYLELVTRDRKLAEPLGLHGCTADCAQQAESVESGASTRWVAENLRGFRLMVTGGDGPGMDDLLVALDQQDLSTALLDATDAAIAEADAGRPLDVELHDAVRQVTLLLEGDVATVLSLRIPSEAAGDAD
jgi:predicted lipoprotein